MKIQLRRHHDDEYVDEVRIVYTGAAPDVLRISLVPRFKTSGLSGDEWRVSARFDLLGQERQGFHDVKAALHYAPAFIWQHARDRLDKGPVRLAAFRKGRLLWSGDFPTFGDAALGMAWHLITASEDQNWKNLTDAEERELCQQPGCSSKQVRIYKYKRYQISRQERHMAEFEYDFQAGHIWFCERHAHRGDCGLEDADANYEVEGGGNAEAAPVDERDVSPSAFGGAVEIDLAGGTE
jgi:hypothetical protein